MELIADGLLIATAFIAGLYCLVLSRRLRRLTDSGAGIGSQIEALDRALAETRAALTETREGVSELRASARAANAELKRRTESGETLAVRLGETVARAETTLERLYEAHDRVEAHERRAAGGGEAGDPAEPGDAGEAPRGWRESVVVDAGPADEAAAPVLEVVGAEAAEAGDDGAAAPEGKGAARRGKKGKGAT